MEYIEITIYANTGSTKTSIESRNIIPKVIVKILKCDERSFFLGFEDYLIGTKTFSKSDGSVITHQARFTLSILDGRVLNTILNHSGSVRLIIRDHILDYCAHYKKQAIAKLEADLGVLI